MNFQDKIIAKYKVKVTKKDPDSRLRLCGEKKFRDGDGNEAFIIPAHQAEYIKITFKHYDVGEPFLPKEDGVAEEVVAEDKPKRRGNPNWIKDKNDVSAA